MPWYVEEVWRNLLPPEPEQTRLITRISIYAMGQSKFVLQTDGHTFELWRGTTSESAYQIVERMQKSGTLPPNPVDAAKSIPIEWRHSNISAEDFGRLHHDFVQALSQVAGNIQGRYDSLMREKVSYLNLHSQRYTIIYENGYQQHLSLETDETGSDSSKVDPMIHWTNRVEKTAARLRLK